MSIDLIAQGIFWMSLVALGFTYFGYPLCIGLLGWSRRKQPRSDFDNSQSPSVTVVLAMRNESTRVAQRIKNLLSSNYPEDRLHILAVCDGCTDSTVEILQGMKDSRLKILEVPQPIGKTACLNLAMQSVDSDLVVFTDARQEFPPATIQRLAGHFQNAQIGAASGSLNIAPSPSGVGGGMDLYWKLEKWIRHSEARWDSSIGCTGAVYAIRSKLFSPLPEDTILDDVVTPMHIALQGYRIQFDPLAVAYDPQKLDPDHEKQRKQRTLGGNFQLLFRYPHWLLPWKNRLWWQLISHKYLRLASPVFMLLALVSLLPLLHIQWYAALLILQIFFYLAACIGRVWKQCPLKCFSIPAGFVFLNLSVISGLIFYLKTRGSQGWDTTTTAHVPGN